MSNRVEELESTVRELRAAVDGLTEELVETRERLRQLEDAQSADAGGNESRGRAGQSSDPHAERVDADGGTDGSTDGSAADAGAAEPPADAASADATDGDVTAEAESDDAADAESDSGSDDDEIIVA